MSEKKQIFSKESLAKVNSPEQLNEYICVAAPSVWLVLGAIILLLAGVCIWGVFGTLNTSEEAVVEISGGEAAGYVSVRSRYPVEAGMKVFVGGKETSVTEVSPQPLRMDGDINSYVFFLGGFSEGDYSYRFGIADGTLPDGIYEARIITDSVNPIRFIIQ